MKVKTILSIVGTVLGTAVVYETALIGSRALVSDVQYIKTVHDGPPEKKHWWSKKQSKKQKRKGVKKK